MICSFANLENDKLNAIQALETEIGSNLLAFACKDIKVASLSDDQLNKVKELENKLDISLVAVSS